MGEIPASANYRESSDPAIACDTCREFNSGFCSMWGTDVGPSMVCDEWMEVVSDHALVAAGAKGHTVRRLHHLNRVLRASTKRAEKLEATLAETLLPVLEAAGDTAAAAFEQKATSHVAASSARRADLEALSGINRADARRIVVGLALTASADIKPNSTMIALYPRADEAAALAELDGEPADLLHVTLCYLGEVESEDVLDTVKAAIGRVAASHAPLEGAVGGVGVFADGGGGHPAILLPDVPGLVDLRQDVVQSLTDSGTEYARNHGYTAHVTVGYRGGPLPPDHASIGHPLHFDEIHVVQGDVTVLSIPLTGVKPLTAAGDTPPPWARPAADELLDVKRLVGTLRTKTDPVRLALLQTVMGPTMPLTDPAETRYLLRKLEASDLDRVSATKLEDQVLYWADEASDVAFDAIEEVRSGEAGALWVLEDRETGKLAAIANVERIGEAEMYAVHNIAAAGGQGAGTSLLKQVAQEAGKESMSVGLVATPEAEGYYRKLPYWKEGEADEGGTRFELPADDTSKFGSGAAKEASPIGAVWDVTNPLTAKVLAQSGSQITEIAKTTQLNVMRIVKASYEEGLSIPDTAKAIRAGMAEASIARATLIARTELVGVVNGGSLAATRIVEAATGDSYTKTWLTAPGAQFPRHEDYEGLDEQTANLDDSFDVGGYSLLFPGDPDGPPEEVCNCRCTMVYTDASGDDQEVGADG